MLRNISTLVFAVVLILTQGCAGNRPYRTTSWETTTTNTPIAINAIEDEARYSLGFIEFDDQGALWNPEQQTAVITHIAEAAKKQGILLFVFVHGWKHNASFEDTNVQLVRDALAGLAKDELKSSVAEKRQPLRVMGVYIGWRGLSLKGPISKNLSFWSRKDTAHKVGYGAVAETFIRLENEIIRANRLTDETFEGQPGRTRSSMISLGHSFGGAVLYSAVSGILTDRIISREEGITSGSSGLGDLVILINPAFEATRIAPLIDGTRKRPETLEGRRRPVLAVFTSKGDWATKVAFPIGRLLSTRHESYRSSAQRKADRTATGHYKPIITHTLKPIDPATAKRRAPAIVPDDPAGNKVQQARAEVKSQKATGRSDTVTYSQLVLEPVAKDIEMTPVLIVTVENSVINGHNDIAKPIFLKFLSEFILSFSELPKN